MTKISASKSARWSSVQARARHSRPASSLSSSVTIKGSSAHAHWYLSSSPAAPPRAERPAASAGRSSGFRGWSATAACRAGVDVPKAAKAAAAAATGCGAMRSSASSALSRDVSVAALSHFGPSVQISLVSSQHACTVQARELNLRIFLLIVCAELLHAEVMNSSVCL